MDKNAKLINIKVEFVKEININKNLLVAKIVKQAIFYTVIRDKELIQL